MQPSGSADPLALVLRVVATFAGVPREALLKTTRIYHDLGIYGDDADELLSALGVNQQIDWTGFRFDAFFPPERTLLTVVARLWRRWKQRYRPLTIGDLAAVVDRRKWFEPTP